MTFAPLVFKGDHISIIDQTVIPVQERWLSARTVDEVAHAISVMQVRGAPLIGITAAFGLVFSARGIGSTGDEFMESFEKDVETLRSTRPTAVNLFWALERMRALATKLKDIDPAMRNEALTREAENILAEDVDMCLAIGRNGAVLVEQGETIMTHCNAGALATGAYGTALGVIRAAHEGGKGIRVIARETRPRLQGARLTAWELHRDNIPVTVIPDGAAAHIMKSGMVHRVIVGADRITANGDVANKIGTYDLALIARAHNIPFHVAAPHSTVDFSLDSGDDIPIEERDAEEVTTLNGERLVAKGVPVMNPAFDVTPADLIDSIITEAGIARPPYTESLKRLLGKRGS